MAVLHQPDPDRALDGSKLAHLILCRVMNSRLAERVAGGIGVVAASHVLLLLAGMAVADPIEAMNWWFVPVLLIVIPALPAHWRMLRGR